MSNPAIRVENVGKQYILGQARRPRSLTLRDQLAHRFTNLFKRPEKSKSPMKVWALKDVSFEVGQGEVLGIVGRNGAGKTTLLKILSRITKPTTGRAEVYGRVASLLEVGTGFHQELSGRENILLNGAILGMTRREIEQKFDEIVSFAEVEKFIDTPVKRYSSGMAVRLAFAVAAHLEPEILLVDEVLAVGDVGFQKKCMGKMGEVANRGRTVLLVSHNMSAIQRLCTSAILIQNGQIEARGSAAEVVQHYLESEVASSLQWERASDRPTKDAYFQRIYLTDGEGKAISVITPTSEVYVTIEFTLKRGIRAMQMSIDLLNSYGEPLFGSSPADAAVSIPSEPGNYKATIRLACELLLPITYGLKATMWQPHGGRLDTVHSLWFTVQGGIPWLDRPDKRVGVFAVRCNWVIEESEPAAVKLAQP